MGLLEHYVKTSNFLDKNRHLALQHRISIFKKGLLLLGSVAASQKNRIIFLYHWIIHGYALFEMSVYKKMKVATKRKQKSMWGLALLEMEVSVLEKVDNYRTKFKRIFDLDNNNTMTAHCIK